MVQLSGGSATAVVAPAGETEPVAPEYVPGEVVVGFTKGADSVQIDSSLDAIDAEDSESVPGLPRTRVIEIDDEDSVEATADELDDQVGVRWAEPNYILRPQSLPNDPYLGLLWGLRNIGQNAQLNPLGEPFYGRPGVDIGAGSAWNVTTGSRRKVAVIDSGIDGSHPDLVANLDRELSRNFVATPSLAPDPVVDPEEWADQIGHGTHVAGTIGAVGNNGLGVTGVNWKTSLVAVRVCGFLGCTSADIAAGMAYVGAKRIPIANVSLGTEGDEPPEEIRVLKEGIKRSPGTLFVVAAGNESQDNDLVPEYPCAFRLKNIVCVAWIDARAGLSPQSNYGAESVDLGAPGERIESTTIEESVPFEEDYADGIDGFDQQPYPWKLGEVDDELRLVFDGRDGAVPSPVPEASATLKKTIDFEGLRFCRLNYELDLELHGEQTLAVQYRVDGGPSRVAPPTVLTAADNTSLGQPADLIADLGQADGAAEVELSFVYRANGTQTPLPGVQLGFMTVDCVAEMPPGGAYGDKSGTSMATPHVAGVAGLVKSVAPKAGPEKLKKIIMRSVVPTKSLKGKTATGGRVSAARAVRFIRPANRARLHRLRVSPKKLRLRPGGSTRLKVRVRNGGGVTARRLRICVKAPRRFVSGTGCTKPRRLGWGKTAKFGLEIRLKGGVRPGRGIRVKTVARARRAGSRESSSRLKVVGPGLP